MIVLLCCVPTVLRIAHDDRAPLLYTALAVHAASLRPACVAYCLS